MEFLLLTGPQVKCRTGYGIDPKPQAPADPQNKYGCEEVSSHLGSGGRAVRRRLYPQKRTFMTASDMSAKGQKRTSHHLFDHRNRAANVIVLKSRHKLPPIVTLLCPVTTMASFRIGVAATAGAFKCHLVSFVIRRRWNMILKRSKNGNLIAGAQLSR